MSKAHFWFQIGLVVEKWLRIQKGSVTNGNGVPLIESQGEAQGVVLAPMGPNLGDEGSWQLQPTDQQKVLNWSLLGDKWKGENGTKRLGI